MTQTIPFPNLEGQQYANLVTFRKSGDGVSTPIWFAREGSTLYVVTMANAGKAKRIRNNPKVQLAPCTSSGKVLGPSVEGSARILSEQEGQHADEVLRNKYGLMYRMFGLMWLVRQSKPIFLAINPA